VKRNIYSTADTVQKTGLQGYQALGKQVSARTGVQLPGATAGMSPMGSPQANRTEADYDDFWAENGVKDTNTTTTTGEPRRPENAAFAGQSQQPQRKQGNSASGKDDEWENW